MDTFSFLPDHSVLEALPCCVLMQHGGRIVYCNPSARALLGLEEGAAVDLPVSEVLLGAYPGLKLAQEGPANGSRSSLKAQGEGAAKDGGEERPPSSNRTSFECVLAGVGGHLIPVCGSYVVLNTSELLILIAALPLASEDGTPNRSTFLEELLDSSPEATVITHGSRILHVNPEFGRLFGYSEEDALGKTIEDLIVPEGRAHECEILTHSVDVHGRASMETVRQHRSGELIDVSILMAPVVMLGERVGYFASYRDIREQKAIEARLQHDALHDALTGLANRALFLDRLETTIARKQRRPDMNYAVMFFDLDRLKYINDTLGHAGGDIVLMTIADRMRSCFRPQDTVARFGGDEFAILLENVTSFLDVKLIAQRMQQEISKPIEVFGHQIVVSGSTGIAFGTAQHTKADEILRDADFAMYRAKSDGGGRHAVFDDAMEMHASVSIHRENELRRAFDEHQFEVWYQPVYHLESGVLEGFEALLRWRRPGGILYPLVDVLPLAEQTGLILPIGHMVIEQACRQARKWDEAMPDSCLSTSVNLSPRQFNQPDLVDMIAEALKRSGVAPGRIRVEIPERAIHQNPDIAVGVFQRLMDLGVSVALDNFGAGLASMNFLVRLPMDLVKIDRRLIAYLPSPGRDAALLNTLFDLGRALRVQMLAEGVETRQQLQALRKLGCDLGQGHLFSPAVPVEAAEKIAQAGQWSASGQATPDPKSLW
ncbi:MAG TPA: EAL domain-containing protein [Acidisarcina sp.]|nr:EAL domain-containing protein [Acidisarcina sp.]